MSWTGLEYLSGQLVCLIMATEGSQGEKETLKFIMASIWTLANFGKTQKRNETIPKFITQLQNHQNKSETLETSGQVESER